MSGERLPLEIRTERLLLRPWRMDDADDVLAYAADPEWTRYLLPSRPYEFHHAVEYLTAKIAADHASQGDWAIEFEGRVIGGTNLDLQLAYGRAEIGYAIARSHWNKGFGTEVCRAVIDIGFGTLPLNRIHVLSIAENLASRRVMEKSGTTFEGTVRHFELHRGEPVDVVMYAILREEWEAAVDSARR